MGDFKLDGLHLLGMSSMAEIIFRNVGFKVLEIEGVPVQWKPRDRTMMRMLANQAYLEFNSKWPHFAPFDV